MSLDLLVIGDVHGKINEYFKLIQKYKGNSIQVGDFGFKKEHSWHLNHIDSKKHKIVFGNHDDYSFLKEEHSLGDYWYDLDRKIMTIRGAYSVDKHLRTQGLDYWENEELSYEQISKALELYELIKPKIMITHDCPDFVRRYLFGIRNKSITSNGLQIMFESHKPDFWIFGHHHTSKNEIIEGTKFICLAELESMVI